MPEVENYTPERIAEFLLNNSLTEDEYRDAVREVLALGVDPTKLEFLIQDASWARPELYVDALRAQRTP